MYMAETCEPDVIDSDLLWRNKRPNAPEVRGSAVISQPLIPLYHASSNPSSLPADNAAR